MKHGSWIPAIIQQESVFFGLFLDFVDDVVVTGGSVVEICAARFLVLVRVGRPLFLFILGICAP